MRLVVDASVALKWFLRFEPTEANVDEAVAILRAIVSGRLEAVQPPHWRAEVAAVIARLRPEFAPQAVGFLFRIRFSVDDAESVVRRAVALAVDLKAHIFDTYYHALAIERDAVLVTADERHFGVARSRGAIRLLDGFEGV